MDLNQMRQRNHLNITGTQGNTGSWEDDRRNAGKNHLNGYSPARTFEQDDAYEHAATDTIL